MFFFSEGRARKSNSHMAPQITLRDLLPTDDRVDERILSDALGRKVQKATILENKKMGGMSGKFVFVDALLEDESTLELVIKAHDAADMKNKALGLPREALFYTNLAQRFGPIVPRCFFSQGDMTKGSMLCVLERLRNAIPAGVVFGPGNPNNWGIRDQLETLAKGNPSAVEMTKLSFELYAKLHAEYWGDQSLLTANPELRGTAWLQGKARSAWETAQQVAIKGWEKSILARENGTSTIQWDQHLVACLEQSFAKLKEGGWERYQEELTERPFSLVHGDAHPHNALWVEKGTSRAKLVLIDFEMVGVGSPAQELGQYLISHMEPETRRKHEKTLIKLYHTQLKAALQRRKDYADHHTDKWNGSDMESLWKEYVMGGIGRWCWFLGWGLSVGGPFVQFFHDQLAAFLHDHIKDATDAPMPRV